MNNVNTEYDKAIRTWHANDVMAVIAHSSFVRNAHEFGVRSSTAELANGASRSALIVNGGLTFNHDQFGELLASLLGSDVAERLVRYVEWLLEAAPQRSYYAVSERCSREASTLARLGIDEPCLSEIRAVVRTVPIRRGDIDLRSVDRTDRAVDSWYGQGGSRLGIRLAIGSVRVTRALHAMSDSCRSPFESASRLILAELLGVTRDLVPVDEVLELSAAFGFPEVGPDLVG